MKKINYLNNQIKKTKILFKKNKKVLMKKL